MTQWRLFVRYARGSERVCQNFQFQRTPAPALRRLLQTRGGCRMRRPLT
jgi:hypothetical protein